MIRKIRIKNRISFCEEFGDICGIFFAWISIEFAIRTLVAVPRCNANAVTLWESRIGSRIAFRCTSGRRRRLSRQASNCGRLTGRKRIYESDSDVCIWVSKTVRGSGLIWTHSYHCPWGNWLARKNSLRPAHAADTQWQKPGNRFICGSRRKTGEMTGKNNSRKGVENCVNCEEKIILENILSREYRFLHAN